ncbi:MAG: amylo-alpha-1,6-glucosidase [Candidatus Pacebacteria bacterium]|nr:amylo-alpha-1,6-glucosidase [Candidatus Paceibacterota bacterium]
MALVNSKKIEKQIVENLTKLKDKKGFLRANSTNYNRLFGRDSLIASWQLLDRDPGICKATLEILSKLQGKSTNREKDEEPGKILHETDLTRDVHPENYFSFPYYGSVDSTPLFLIVFAFYFRKTKDFDFLNSHWKNILAAFNWMETCGDKDKDLFLEYESAHSTGLFHQCWKDSFENHLKMNPPVAIVEAQGYQYSALMEMAYLAGIKKDYGLAQSAEKRARALKEVFNEKFWLKDCDFFALGLDGAKMPRKAIASNPGLLLFTGIVDEEKIDPTVSRLFKDDLWTPFGIRTHSSLESDFDPFNYHLGTIWPHDNWIIAEGLRKLGKNKEYKKVRDAVLEAVKGTGFKYMPEYYVVSEGKLIWSPGAGNPQAWTVGAISNFLEISRTIDENQPVAHSLDT